MLGELRLHLRRRLVTSPTVSILGSSTVFACSKENSFRFLVGDTYKSWLRCLIGSYFFKNASSPSLAEVMIMSERSSFCEVCSPYTESNLLSNIFREPSLLTSCI